MPLTILICGGGNGAHTLAGLASASPDMEVRVMTLFADEAERWSKLLESTSITVPVTYNDGTTDTLLGKPKMVTKDPAVAVPGADVIIFVVPAFAHQQYFDAIAQYVKPGTVIFGMPGQAGFEFQALGALKHLEGTCAILSAESLPWACRILKFGTEVQVLGFKESMGCSMVLGSGQYKTPPMELTQKVLGKMPVLTETKNYLSVTLNAQSVIHCPIMYGQWKDWDGKPMKEKPLFYQGVDDLQADLVTKVADEVVVVAREIQKQFPALDMTDVIDMHTWYKIAYPSQIVDNSSLRLCMNTNKAYDGLVHPMKEVDGGFVPDFNNRYISEDMPFGLVVLKGIAILAGVETPTMDEVIRWCQDKLGKSYLVGSELTGKDVQFSRAPQVYGFTSLKDLCTA